MTAKCEYCGSRHYGHQATSGCANCGAPIQWEAQRQQVSTSGREAVAMRGYLQSFGSAFSPYAQYVGQQNPVFNYSDYLRQPHQSRSRQE